MRRLSTFAPLLATIALLWAAAPAFGAGPGTTFLTGGLELPAGAIAGAESGSGPGNPERSAVSADGRYVAFTSAADTLDPAVNPDVTNVFRKDRLTGAVVLVSRAAGAAGAVVDEPARDPAISDDGSRVGFVTEASLDPADTDGGRTDVYVRDVTDGTTKLASLGDGVAGAQTTDNVVGSYDLAGDGRWVAFTTDTALTGADLPGSTDVYRRDLTLGRTVLVSLNAARTGPGQNTSSEPAISDDGAFVAFISVASDLVPGFFGGGGFQVFVRDVGAGTTSLVSNSAGLATKGGDGESFEPDIAGAPGGLSSVVVAYETTSMDVASGGIDPSPQDSVYVHAMSGTSSTLVSLADGATRANADSRAHSASISDDGTRVMFASDAVTAPDSHGTYLRDLATDRTLLASTDTRYAVHPSISGDGSYFAWYNGIGITPDSDPDLPSVFGRTYTGGALGPAELVSRPPGTAPFLASAAPIDSSGGGRTISADGRYVVFASLSSRLPGGAVDGPEQVYRRDVLTGAVELVSRASGANGAPGDSGSDTPTISADGTRVAFRSFARLDPADTDTLASAYVRDMTVATTRVASRAAGLGGALPDANVSDPRISADGQHVAFLSDATNLGAGSGRHAYLRDLVGGRTMLVDRATGVAGTVGNGNVDDASPSADGTLVAFTTSSNNLDPDDSAGFALDVYVRDTVAATTTLVSRRPGLNGAHAAGSSRDAAISADGRVVAFRADDSSLATEAGPWLGKQQIVARMLATGANVLVSHAPGGPPANDDAVRPSVSGDGAVVAFETPATNLLPGLGGVTRDAVFARTMASGALSGPPAFGLADGASGSANHPSISDDGRCLAFGARGHNAATGPAGDFYTGYVYVISGDCWKPLPVVVARSGVTRTPRPALTGVSMSHKRFRVGRSFTARAAVASRAVRRRRARRAPVGTAFRFTLSARANVAIALERPAQGRLVGRFCRRPTRRLRRHLRCVRFVRAGRLTRGGVGPGRVTIVFSGRVGRKALKPGAYRARLRASNAGGVSRLVRLSFRVVR